MMNRADKALARAALRAVARNSRKRHHGAAFPERVWEADHQWMLEAHNDRPWTWINGAWVEG